MSHPTSFQHAQTLMQDTIVQHWRDYRNYLAWRIERHTAAHASEEAFDLDEGGRPLDEIDRDLRSLPAAQRSTYERVVRERIAEVTASKEATADSMLPIDQVAIERQALEELLEEANGEARGVGTVPIGESWYDLDRSVDQALPESRPRARRPAWLGLVAVGVIIVIMIGVNTVFGGQAPTLGASAEGPVYQLGDQTYRPWVPSAIQIDGGEWHPLTVQTLAYPPTVCTNTPLTLSAGVEFSLRSQPWSPIRRYRVEPTSAAPALGVGPCGSAPIAARLIDLLPIDSVAIGEPATIGEATLTVTGFVARNHHHDPSIPVGEMELIVSVERTGGTWADLAPSLVTADGTIRQGRIAESADGATITYSLLDPEQATMGQWRVRSSDGQPTMWQFDIPALPSRLAVVREKLLVETVAIEAPATLVLTVRHRGTERLWLEDADLELTANANRVPVANGVITGWLEPNEERTIRVPVALEAYPVIDLQMGASAFRLQQNP